MKRVCIISTAHRFDDVRIFTKQAKTLQENGYDVYYVVQNENKESFILNKIHIVPIPKARTRFYRMVVLPWVALRRALALKADVYHIHDPELLIAAVVLKVLFRKRLLYDVHENYASATKDKAWIPKPLRKLASKLTRATECVLSLFVDAIVAATESIGRQFNSTKTVIVRNYPLVGNLALVKNDLTSMDETVRIAYVGILSRNRGAFEMIKALEYLDGISGILELHIYGQFRPAQLEEELRILQGFKYVKFHGWVQQDKVFEGISKADIGLLLFHPVSNHIEALPNKLFEYMVVGLPFVASDFPLWRKLVQNEECGLLANPLDPVDISEKIQLLIDNKELALRMGSNGQKAVEEKYNWNCEARTLLSIYKQLLED